MRFSLAVGMIMSLLLPALAQDPQTEQQIMRQEIERRDREDRQRQERAAETDKAYQRQLKDSASRPLPKTDPWGNVRDSGKQNAQPRN